MFLRPRCSFTSTGAEHIDYAHYEDTDVCICGWDSRPCKGDCGLEDMSFIPFNPVKNSEPTHWNKYVPH